MESEKIAGAAGGRKITGHISQIIGPVVDVAFEGPENEVVRRASMTRWTSAATTAGR